MIAGPHVTSLRILHAIPPDPALAQTPRVLCARTVTRLAALNRIVRRLREAGAWIVEQQIDGEHPARNQPLVRVRPDPDDTGSQRRIMEIAAARSYLCLGGRTERVGIADGVVVIMELP